MANKVGFGITELNLIGSSGTPKIDSPNNLNINAVNVAISTNATVGGNLDVDGHTELDDVNVSGVSTFANKINVGSGVTIDASGQASFTGIITSKSSVLVEGGNVIVDIGSLNQGFYLKNGNSTHLGISWSSSASRNYFSGNSGGCLLYTSPSPRDRVRSRMPSSA